MLIRKLFLKYLFYTNIIILNISLSCRYIHSDNMDFYSQKKSKLRFLLLIFLRNLLKVNYLAILSFYFSLNKLLKFL